MLMNGLLYGKKTFVSSLSKIFMTDIRLSDCYVFICPTCDF